MDNTIMTKLMTMTRNKVNPEDAQKVVTYVAFLYWITLKQGRTLNLKDRDFFEMIEAVQVFETDVTLKEALSDLYDLCKHLELYDQTLLNTLLETINSVTQAQHQVAEIINTAITTMPSRKEQNMVVPESIRTLMSRLIAVENKTKVADLFMGTGSIGLTLKRIYPTVDFEYYGQEINKSVYFFAQIIKIVNNLSAFNLQNKDAYAIKKDQAELFDVVLMDPPFSPKYTLEEDPTVFKYGIPNKIAVDWANYQLGLYHLKPTGKAIVTATAGALYRSSDSKIREKMIMQDLIEAVILLPAHLYKTTAINTAIIVFNKQKPPITQNKVIFVNATQDYINLQKGKRVIPEANMQKIIQAVLEEKDQEGFSTRVDLETISQNDFNLNPSVYINAKTIKLKLKKSIPLSEVASIQPGVQINQNDFENLKTGATHYYLNVKNIKSEGIVYHDANRIRAKKTGWQDRYAIQAEDILLISRGTVKRMIIVPKDFKPAFISNNLTIIRVNPKHYNPYILKKYLESDVGGLVLDNITTGSAIKMINARKLGDIRIPDYDQKIIQQVGQSIAKNEETYQERLLEAKKKFDEEEVKIQKALKL